LVEITSTGDHQDPVTVLSETAQSAGRGPLRFVILLLLFATIAAGTGMAVTGRLMPIGNRLIASIAALLPGQASSALAARPLSTPSLSGPLTLVSLSPTEVLQQFPPMPGQSLSDGAFYQPNWQRYRRPAAPLAAGTPHVAILMSGLGLNKALSASAILYLPPDVSLSFSPYAPDLAIWIAAARAHGHEALVDLPMESAAPQDDPGIDGLMTGLKPSENSIRLGRITDRATGALGIATALGSRFLTDRAALAPVLSELSDHGLAVIEASADPRMLVGEIGAESKLPRVKASIAVDEAQGRDDILRDLADLTTTALNGVPSNAPALAVVAPSPLSLALIASWCRQLPSQGIALTPVSNLLVQ
jgi:hypothetical protein